MEQNNFNSEPLVVLSSEEIKQKAMIELCQTIGYAFKMETPVDYSINGRTYKTSDVPGAIISFAGSLKTLAESAYNKTVQ